MAIWGARQVTKVWVAVWMLVFGLPTMARAQSPPDVVEYYHLDGLGSVRAVTDAAGAVVSNESAQRAAQLGLDAADHLSRNDAYSFFDPLDDLIKTGSSGTNVNDLVICLAF